MTKLNAIVFRDVVSMTSLPNGNWRFTLQCAHQQDGTAGTSVNVASQMACDQCAALVVNGQVVPT